MEKASFSEHWLPVFAKFSLDFFVIEMGADIKVVYSGGKTPSYFGYPVEAFVKQIEGSFGDIVLDIDQPRVAKAMAEAKEFKADIDMQFYLFCFDRSISLVHVAGSYLYSHEEVSTYLFLISDEKQGIFPIETKLECFSLCFSVDTGSLVEVNLQGRIAFLVHEFTNIYEAITIFAAQYVHPQDRKAFAVFADSKVLTSSTFPKGEQKEIPFRRMSYNEVFSGYRWSLLSYSLEEGGEGQGLVCELLIQDSDNIASKLAEKTLQTQLDPLTGILNRSALEMQVTQQIALCSGQDNVGAFFMLDIDHFKWINDTFGHDKGDIVLRQVTNSIKGVFCPTDIIARPGGDEFAVFITGLPSKEMAMTKAENMCRALRSLGKLEEEMQLSCSVGVSIFPENGTSFEELYHTSDLALYQAKRMGRDQYCLYEKHSVSQSKERPIDREWLFSQMEEEIYLCNVDTYTLLFANDALLKRLGLTSLPTHGYCYEVLLGRSTPCEDCKKLYMKKGQASTRICKNTESNTLYIFREKCLLLKGERVKLSVSSPISQTLMDFLQEKVNLGTLESLS